MSVKKKEGTDESGKHRVGKKDTIHKTAILFGKHWTILLTAYNGWSFPGKIVPFILVFLTS